MELKNRTMVKNRYGKRQEIGSAASHKGTKVRQLSNDPPAKLLSRTGNETIITADHQQTITEIHA